MQNKVREVIKIIKGKEGFKKDMLKDKIKWLGHASFRIEGEKIIYFDPWKIKNPVPADLILITHPHFDHCSQEDIAKIQKKDTVIVTVAECKSQISGNIKVIKPGETIEVDGIKVEAVPAYNIDKTYHPKEKGWAGLIVEVEGERVYHTGDSDFIPEMNNVSADIMLIPVGGTYTMTVEEGVKAAKAVNPRYAVPMHCGTIVGSIEDVERFKKLYSGEVLDLTPQS